MHEIVYGIHAVHALLECNPQNVLAIYIQKGTVKKQSLLKLIKKIEDIGIVIQITKKCVLNDMANDARHQGIIAKIRITPQIQENHILNLLSKYKEPFFLVLDGITDPHNLGACIRSADATGVHAVIIPRHGSSKMNATIKKVASGATETVPLIRVTNLARTLSILKQNNVWIVGTVVENVENTIFDSKLTGSLAIVIGSEDKGISPLIRCHCNVLIKIPMVGIVSSLNVSVAAGVCLFESMRQRITLF